MKKYIILLSLLVVSVTSQKTLYEDQIGFLKDEINDLPMKYDARERFPNCFNSPLLNERSCKSSSIIATAFVLSTRFCIHDKKNQFQENFYLSAEDYLGCIDNSGKCKADPSLGTVWKTLERNGVCKDSCKPFTAGLYGEPGRCHNYCAITTRNYTKYKAQQGSINSLSLNIEDIKRRIYEYGPITTTMKKFKSLDDYRIGVYKCSDNQDTDFEVHSVAIVGWGYDSLDGEYWTVANSFGPMWGEEGYFKIGFGECGIVSAVAYDGMPDYPDNLFSE